MNTPDLKRLISAFLAFSVTTSVITLVSFNFIGNSPQSQNKDSLQVEGGDPLSTISKNAFVENLPENGTGASAPHGTSNAYKRDSARDNSNLTQNFATVFASQMIENNPNGPRSDGNGNPTTLNLPGQKTAEEMIRQAVSKTTFQFDEKVAVSEDKILKSFGPDDVSGYLDQTQKIFADVSSAIKNYPTNQSSTPEDLTSHALAIEAALEKLSSLSVPQPLAGLHKEVLNFFANQKNVLYAVTNYQSDPLKTIVAIQNEKEIVARDIERVNGAGLKVNQRALSLNNNPEWKKFYSEIFGIQKVYAQGLPTYDNANFITGLARLGEFISNNIARITEWAYTTALRVAVNLLINEFQNQVVNWISGGGKPKFITDWNGFLNDVANKAAGETIYSIAPRLCTGIGPVVIQLFAIPRAPTAVRCTLTQVVNNVNSFFNSFRNGKWYAFSYAMQPNNNFFGSIIEAHDAAVTEAAKAQNAAQSEAVASKGFLSVTRCVDERINQETGETYCAREETTTPGATVGEALTQSLGWKPNQIVSAQRFEDLVAAIVNASINRVIKDGLSALTPPRNPPAPSFTNATPSNVNNPGSIRNAVNSLDQAGVFRQNQTIINSDTQWLALAFSTTSASFATSSTATSTALGLLNQYASVCTANSALVTERINNINILASSTRAELNSALNLAALRSTALSATSSQDAANILGQLAQINISQITNAATAAQDRLASMQYFITFIQNAVHMAAIDGFCNPNLISVTSTPPTSNP